MDRVCFHIGDRPVYWYGILVAAGLAAAYVHYSRLARREGRADEIASSIVFWATLGGLAGARLAYVAANWSTFAGRWIEVFRIDHGGLIFYGGAIGGAAALAWFARRSHLEWRRFADFVITGLPLGHAFGRIGCFLNGCCYGKETDLWPDVLKGRYPVQLAEAAGNILIYLTINYMYKKRPRVGAILFLYLVLYPSLRFVLEMFRGDERARWLGVTVAQWVSVVLFAAGVVGLWFFRGRRDEPAVPAA